MPSGPPSASSTPGSPDGGPARSFAQVADAYDRGRPDYPAEAAVWLTGDRPRRILELGAGTGKLTTTLVELGHEVVATDPLPDMLDRLAANAPRARTVVAEAERIPLPARSVDVVASAQAFHWFDHARALPEIARVLRPGGHIALVWNDRDERIPWVRRLGATMGGPGKAEDPTHTLLASGVFGYVESATFRSWQPLDRARLRDLVRSRSNVVAMTETERQRLLAAVDTLYDEYGRGADGMLLPYVTRCYRAVVRPQVSPEPDLRSHRAPQGPAEPPHDGDDGLLIDFR